MSVPQQRAIASSQVPWTLLGFLRALALSRPFTAKIAMRSVYYLLEAKRADDKCWFCSGRAKMTRSHVLLHCPNPRLRAARAEAWEGKDPGGVRVSLANPRWERRFVKFLELSGVGRVMADGTDSDQARATRMDEWVI
jgi:hypothetical protein